MMRRLLFPLLLLLPLLSVAQEGLRRITAYDVRELKAGTGLPLDSRWRFHAGDGSRYGHPVVDVSNWPKLNPALDLDTLSQGAWKGEGWFVLTLEFVQPTDSLPLLGLALNHPGASEVYWNGEKLAQFGVVGDSLPKEQPLMPRNQPILLPLGSAQRYVLAVHYSHHKAETYYATYGRYARFAGFRASLVPYLKAQTQYATEAPQTELQMIMGAFLTLCVLHLLLFLFSTREALHLWYSVVTGATFYYAFTRFQLVAATQFGPVYILHQILSAVALATFMTAFMGFLYTAFYNRVLRQFYYFVPLTLVLALTMIYNQQGVSIVLAIVLSIFMLAESYQAIVVQGNPAQRGSFWAIGIGILFPIISGVVVPLGLAMVSMVITIYKGVFGGGIDFNLSLAINDFFTKWPYLSLLALPLSMSVFLARTNAEKNRELETQVHEIKGLSEKALSAEKEKQRLVRQQNLLLEQQVAERTGEISHQKAEIERINDILSVAAEEVRQKNRHLEDTMQQLRITQEQQLIQQEKMAALGALVAGVAHEINTPLGVINGANKDLMHTLPEVMRRLPQFLNSLSPELHECFFRLIDRAETRRLNLSSREERTIRTTLVKELQTYKLAADVQLIAREFVRMNIERDVREFLPLLQLPNVVEVLQVAADFVWARIHTDNIDLAVSRTQKIVYALKSYAHRPMTEEAVETSVVDNLEVVLTIYHNQLKHGVEVERHYGRDLPPILAYPDELNQVWTNLIHNALQAMQYKGKLVLEAERQNGHIIVKITDSGPGIPAKVLPRIFEPFFTTKAQGEGTGLGLGICQKIVQKHNGDIAVDTEPGRTTFIVKLPVHVNQPAAAHA